MPNTTVPAAATGLPNARRAFLQGLVSLPLIGGGVTLIGNPTAAAEPISRELLTTYLEWLFMERRLLSLEVLPALGWAAEDVRLPSSAARRFHTPHDLDWRQVPKPSTRAALVLGTVGCEWRKGRG